MPSNNSSDQDELNDSVSKADIDKMIKFLHAHTDDKVVKDQEPKHSTPKEVKLKTEGSSSTKPPPSPPVRSSSFLLSNALKGYSLFGDTSVVMLIKSLSYLYFLARKRVKPLLMFESWK